MKDLIGGNMVSVPMSSAVCSFERQPKRLLSLSSCQDHIPSATSKILSKLKQREYFFRLLMNNQLDTVVVLKSIT